MRNLERQIGSLCRKAAKEIVEDGVKKVTFKADNLEKYLGHEKYLPDVVSDKDAVGSVLKASIRAFLALGLSLSALVNTIINGISASIR